MYYQFLSSRNAISNLERHMVKVSRIKAVNDLFELQPYLRVERVKRKQLVGLRTEVANTYGMVCFSSDWQEPIMWGHYADCNKGIVLGFEMIYSRFAIKQVTYPQERTRISLDPLSITASDYIEAVGFIKYTGWSYEKEHRFFVNLDDCVRIEDDYFLAFGNDLRLKQVIIGPAHACKNRRDYTRAAKYIVELVKRNSAQVIVAREEFGGYRVVRCGTWTPKLEQLLRA
jgi:hypothetical protein